MGNWGLGTDEGDGPHDLLDTVLHAVGLQRDSATDSISYKRKMKQACLLAIHPTIHIDAGSLLRPTMPDIAGFVLIMIRREQAVFLPTLALEIAEVALRRELLPAVLRGWQPGRRSRVKMELAVVRAELARRT